MDQVWSERLRAAGYRLTKPRDAVVQVMVGSDKAMDANEVYKLARGIDGAIGLVSVYRALDALQELGLITRVHKGDGRDLYLAAGQGHEHVLICERCQRAQYFGGGELDDLFAELAEKSGYEITGHWLQVFGICPVCQEREDKQHEVLQAKR